MSQAQTLEKKIPFEQPHGRIFDLLKAITDVEEKDVLDVSPSCQSIGPGITERATSPHFGKVADMSEL